MNTTPISFTAKEDCLLKLRKKAKPHPIDQEKQCPIDHIISKKMGGDNIWYYEVKWRNQASYSWESIDTLQPYKEIIEKFDRLHYRKENRDKIMQEDGKPVKRIKTKLTSQREIPMKIEQTEGKFELGDKIKDIVLAKIVTNEKNMDKEIYCLIEWQARSNGYTPICSFVNTKDVRRYEPVMLINFYEKKVVFKPTQITMARTEALYKLYFDRNI